MYIWKISQVVNKGYDTYNSAIVYAETEFEARSTHPNSDWEYCIPSCLDEEDYLEDRKYAWEAEWAPISDVSAECVGDKWDAEPGVILASYHAG